MASDSLTDDAPPADLVDGVPARLADGRLDVDARETGLAVDARHDLEVGACSDVEVDAGARGGAATEAPRRALWQGRAVLLVGIVLLGLSLRHAVTGLAPLLPQIQRDLGLGADGATMLGMAPTLMFGLAGFAAPVLIRRGGLAATAALAMILATTGTLGRSLVDGVPSFLVLSALALLGMGVGNVVGAPLVKRYFPDRPAPVLATFALLMQVGSAVPAVLALPLADAGGGWRFSVGAWALVSFAAAIPWVRQVAVAIREGRDVADGPDIAHGNGLVEEPVVVHRQGSGDGAVAVRSRAATSADPRLGVRQLVANPVAAGTALFYAMASLNSYAMLAWLPTIAQSYGHSETAAATAYSIFASLAVPMAVIGPLLGARLRDPFPFAALLSAAAAIGYLGLIVAPELATTWAFAIGIVNGAFPLAIAMFYRRTRTEAGTASLSGFAMGVGYLAGTLGPLLGGWLSAITGSWDLPLAVYAVTSVPMLVGAWRMTKPGPTLEDAALPTR